MSSPVDGNGKRNDPSAYAPKWVRGSDRERNHEDTSIPEDKYPQQSEQSVPETASDRPTLTHAAHGVRSRPRPACVYRMAPTLRRNT